MLRPTKSDKIDKKLSEYDNYKTAVDNVATVTKAFNVSKPKNYENIDKARDITKKLIDITEVFYKK